MNETANNILARFDSGQDAATIAEALGVTVGRVYAVLREFRPDRERKPRRRTSDKLGKIRGLALRGICQSRIAFLCGTSRQYIHKVLNEEIAQ